MPETGNGAHSKLAAIVIVLLARRRERSGGHRLASTSFLQLTSCGALVLDGTEGFRFMFLCKTQRCEKRHLVNRATRNDHLLSSDAQTVNAYSDFWCRYDPL